VPLTGGSGGGVAFAAGKLVSFLFSRSMSNASGVDSGENCAADGGGGSFAGAAANR